MITRGARPTTCAGVCGNFSSSTQYRGQHGGACSSAGARTLFTYQLVHFRVQHRSRQSVVLFFKLYAVILGMAVLSLIFGAATVAVAAQSVPKPHILLVLAGA